MRVERIACIVLLLLSFFVIFPPFPALAEQKDTGLAFYADGMEAYDTAQYDEALTLFGQAIEKDSHNLQFQYYYGLCYAKMNKYDEARAIFSAIASREPKKFHHVYFDLAGIDIKQKQYEKAMKTLDDAEWASPKNARVYMEKGYLYRVMKQYAKAEQNFKRAMELDPSLAQMVWYQTGVTRLQAGRYEDAMAMFRKAEKGPDPDLAAIAGKALDRSGAMKRAAKPWHLFFNLGWAYDSNIPNDPLDRPGISPQPTTDLGDQYQVLSFHAYGHASLTRYLGADAGYMFSWLNYSDSDNENSVGNIPYLRLAYAGKSWGGDIRYSYGYYTADGKEKQKQHGVYPSMYVQEPWGMQSRVALVYQDKDYLDDGLTPDATHWEINLRQLITLSGKTYRPYVGLSYGDEDADTDESTYDYMEAVAGIMMKLPRDIDVDVSYTDIRTDYEAVYGTGKREDSAYLISVMASKQLMDQLSARLSYMYVKNNSNVTAEGFSYDPFEYEKHVVFVQMEVTL